MLPSPCFCRYTIRCLHVIASILLIPIVFTSPAYATVLVNVDHRVIVEFSPMVVGQTAKDYATDVVITNDSLAEILSPLRVVITSIDQHNTFVSNADGTTGGHAYIEIDIPGGVLAVGESTAAAKIEFERAAGNSTPGSSGNGKTKNTRFRTFLFESLVLGGSTVAPRAPTSTPNALSVGTGDVDVVFGIGVLSDGPAIGAVSLRSLDGSVDTPANDLGNDGDTQAGDSVYGATLKIDTNGLSGGDCLSYVGVTTQDNVEVISTVYQLCATQFPVGASTSNTDPGNLIVIEGGGEAIADEVLIKVIEGTSEDDILQLLNTINGEVVGTVLQVSLYQVRLAKALTAAQLDNLIHKLENRAEVAAASPNGLGSLSSEPDDLDSSPAVQHGLKLVRANDVWGDRMQMQPDPWDNSVATGAGVTVVVLDLGVDASHADLVGQVEDPAPMVTNPVGDGNTDINTDPAPGFIGHGTAMAGIIAAATDNGTGIAGVAPGVQLQSVKIVDISPFSDIQLIDGYQNLASPGVTGTIVNASVNTVSTGQSGVMPTGSVIALCEAINNAINSGTGKLIINSAGNQGANGNRWPGRCNDAQFDSIRPPADRIDNKEMFIVVGGTACNADPCPPDVWEAGSNFGRWLDVAAPGSNVNSTELNDLYGARTGTSVAAALTSGAAAILSGCGVPLGSIEATLQMGNLVQVDYDAVLSGSTVVEAAGTIPRIDVFEALKSFGTAPSNLKINGGSTAAIPELAGPLPADTTTSPITVGSLSVDDTDDNSCDPVSYEVISGLGDDGSDFVISGDQLQFDTGVLLDAEGIKTSFNVTVLATDFYGLTAANLPITVTLTGINDNDPVISPPGTTPGSTETHPENSTNVFAVSATDADLPAQTLSAITVDPDTTLGANLDGALFEVVGGQLKFKSAPDFETPADNGADNKYNVMVTVSDGEGGIGSASYVIEVTDVDEGVIVPNVVGGATVDASSSIVAAGLAVGAETLQASVTVAAGLVISQTPAAGTTANSGTFVDLVVSSGLPPNPVIAFTFEELVDPSGKAFILLHYQVTNRDEYPAEMFTMETGLPDLPTDPVLGFPPCQGSDSRTVILMYAARSTGSDRLMTAVCSLSSSDDLADFRFARDELEFNPDGSFRIEIIYRDLDSVDNNIIFSVVDLVIG